MFRRSAERISLLIGGTLIGAIGYYEYEKLQPRLPVPLPSKPTALTKLGLDNVGEFKVKRVSIL
jgi:hypothetical protein